LLVEDYSKEYYDNMAEKQGNLYYINNKTYVCHFKDVKTVISSTLESISEQRNMYVITENGLSTNGAIEQYMESIDYSGKFEIVLEDNDLDLFSNSVKTFVVFTKSSQLVECVAGHYWNIYSELSGVKDEDAFKVFLKEVFWSELFFESVYINEDMIDNVELTTEPSFEFTSRDVSLDILMHIIETEENPSDEAVEMFYEKMLVLQPKITRIQSESSVAKACMLMYRLRNVLNLSDSDLEIVKEIGTSDTYASVNDLKNMIEKYSTQENLDKIKEFSQTTLYRFLEFKESYQTLYDLYRMNAQDIKEMTFIERKLFLDKIVNQLIYFGSRKVRIPYNLGAY
jgi:hypothetical protein